MSPVIWALLALLPPVAVALLIVAIPPLRRAGAPAIWLSIGAATLAFAGAMALLAGLPSAGGPEIHEFAWLFSGAEPLATMGVRLDGISIAMLVVVTAVALAVQVYSASYLHDEPAPALGRYYACQSLFLFAMNLLVLSTNLLQLFIGWELVGVASYLLIGFWYTKPSAARAALKAFWITKLADSGFIIALVVLHGATGSFSWDVPEVLPHATAITLLLFLAVMGKSAQFPLHVWLPDAMEGPTPVSALLHAATMVAAGVFLVVRAFPLFEHSPDTLVVMAHVGAFTAFFAGCVAIAQTDLKKILAYSTCSQLGVMFAGLGAGSQMAGFFHLTTHAAFKAMLFLAAGSVIHAVHSNELSDMGGLARRMKLTATAFIVGALALAGLPGLSGFFSKDLILEAIAERDLPIVLVLVVAAAGLTAFYMGRAVVLTFFGEPSKKAEHAHEPSLLMLLPILVLIVPTVALGYFGGPFAGLLGEEHHFHLGAVGIVGIVLALAGLGMAWLVFGTKSLPASTFTAFAPAARVARSGAVDRLHLMIYSRGFRSLGHVSGWVDRYIIDSVMNVVGWVFVAGGKSLRVVQTGNVADYVWAVMAAAMLLVAWGATR